MRRIALIVMDPKEAKELTLRDTTPICARCVWGGVIEHIVTPVITVIHTNEANRTSNE